MKIIGLSFFVCWFLYALWGIAPALSVLAIVLLGGAAVVCGAGALLGAQMNLQTRLDAEAAKRYNGRTNPESQT